jgi:hypothetical protein
LLKILCIASNNLYYLPKEICEINLLEELDLSFNSISEEKDFDLWRKLAVIKKLNILSLHNNKIKTI